MCQTHPFKRRGPLFFDGGPPHCWVSSPHPHARKVLKISTQDSHLSVLFTPLRLINGGLHYIRIKSTSKIYSHTREPPFHSPTQQTCSLFNFFPPPSRSRPRKILAQISSRLKKKSVGEHILTDDKRARAFSFPLKAVNRRGFFEFYDIR